jgi:hypothetical protein
VVPAHVLESYPELVQLWSISRNTAGHVQQKVNEITGMNLLYQLWTEQLRLKETPCYTTIVMNVTRGQPWWQDMIEVFIAFLARHAGDVKNATMWTFFSNWHAHKVPSEERMMPSHVWAHLAIMYEVRCAYGIAFAVYLCPEEAVESHMCNWISVTELRKCVHKDKKEARASAEVFLSSVADLLEPDGVIHTRVSTNAKVDPMTAGRDTLDKAKRTAGQMSVDIYIQVAEMVGRYLCEKPQHADFGKPKAEHLADIAARMRILVREAFPDLGKAECLDTVVFPRIPLQVGPSSASSRSSIFGSGGGPLPAVPNRGASAVSSVPVMPQMSTINSHGERVGVTDRLSKEGMEIGSKVRHRTLDGVYKIKAVDVAGDGDGLTTVKLALALKCVSMEQLWDTLPGLARFGPRTAAQSVDNFAFEDTAVVGATTATSELGAAAEENKPDADAPPMAASQPGAGASAEVLGTAGPACSVAGNPQQPALAPLPAPATPAPGTPAPPELAVGHTVSPCGLINATELNGQAATICSWCPDKARWEVRFANGHVKFLKPENLQHTDVICEGASAGAGNGVASAGAGRGRGRPRGTQPVLPFEKTKAVDLEKFLDEWKAVPPTTLVEYVFNAHWPADRLTLNEKHIKNIATAHAFTAMAILGHKMDQGISPSSVLQHLEKPHAAWFVKTGELALGTNRKR